MTLIDKIKKSVEGSTGLPFLYHAAGEINELIARCRSLPVAYSFLIDSGTIDDVNGRYHERVTLAVMFCDKTEFDFNALENEEIIDRMKEKAYKWMSSLRMSNTLNVVSVNNTQRLYDTTTDILTGFAVNITIEDVAGVGECELLQVVIDVKKNGSYDVVGVDKVRVKVLPKMDELEVTKNGEYLPPTDITGFSKVSVDVQPVLEELTITENGTYTPQDGVDGFSKVVAEFDTSSLPKVKVGSFKVTNACINDDGVWEGEQLIDISAVSSLYITFRSNTKIKYLDASNWDTSNVTDMQSMFSSCYELRQLDVSNWDTSNVTNMQSLFHDCVSLKNLDVSKWDVSKVTNINGMFRSIHLIESLDLTKWDVSKVTNNDYMFYDQGSKGILRSIIGGRTIEDVINNDISCLNGLKVAQSNMFTYVKNLDRASLRALINGLADLTGQTAKTLTLGATLRAKITEEDIAVATNKNWTIV